MSKHRTTMDVVVIDYTNWRNERGERRITPVELTFDSNEWHKEKTWLLKAYDHRLKGFRTFAMNNIHSWRTETIDTYVQMGRKISEQETNKPNG